MVRPRALRSPREGTAVVIAFQDHSTGQEFTVTNDGKRGKRITVAWTGREVGIHYPGVRPHAYRFANDPSEGNRGLGRPAFAVFLLKSVRTDDGHTSTRLVRVTAWTSTPNVAPGSWTWWSASWDLSSLRRRPWWGW
ncbi:hypothetical protein [Streptomyces sp. CB01201]|uniref:hypothetical protein n=1 Tax=Streptomyces sp. CB01201 TaxID=2020324 RepID=UPI001F48909B|nr:hypothetical protein [Streptomyces sp. CB01201]